MLLSDRLAQVYAGPEGPQVAAFFDFDGTLIHGFSAVDFYLDRIRSGKVGPARGDPHHRLGDAGHRDRGGLREARRHRPQPGSTDTTRTTSRPSASGCSPRSSRPASTPRRGSSCRPTTGWATRSCSPRRRPASSSRPPRARSASTTCSAPRSKPARTASSPAGPTAPPCGGPARRGPSASSPPRTTSTSRPATPTPTATRTSTSSARSASPPRPPRRTSCASTPPRDGWPVLDFRSRGLPSLPTIARSAAAMGGILTGIGTGAAFGLLNGSRRTAISSIMALSVGVLPRAGRRPRRHHRRAARVGAAARGLRVQPPEPARRLRDLPPAAPRLHRRGQAGADQGPDLRSAVQVRRRGVRRPQGRRQPPRGARPGGRQARRTASPSSSHPRAPAR